MPESSLEPERGHTRRVTSLLQRASTLVLLGFVSAAQVGAAEPAATDLRLEWLVDGRPRAHVDPLRGRAGESVVVVYRLGNVGTRDAFAVVLRAHTALGPAGSSERLEPGPASGRSVDRSLTLSLAEGMRELCIEARLQNRSAGDPPDPNPRDNRICRRIEVEAPKSVALRHPTDRVAYQRRNHHASPSS